MSELVLSVGALFFLYYDIQSNPRVCTDPRERHSKVSIGLSQYQLRFWILERKAC